MARGLASRECFSKLFGPPWTVVALAEKTTCRFGATKVLWEVVATQCEGNSAKHNAAQDGESADAACPPVS
jgi:hypothetical protein